MTNPFSELPDLTDAELADLLRGIRHARSQRARDEGVDTLAQLFDDSNRTTQTMIDELDAIANDKDTEQ